MNHQIDIQDVALHCTHPGEQLIRHWVETTIETTLPANLQPAEVCIRIVDEAESQRLNAQYRKKNSATNVLSFHYDLPAPAQEENHFLGDLVICGSVLAKEAQSQHKTLEAHWAHMIIHGLLHLMGYDHQNEQQALAMESREISMLANLNFPNPYEEKPYHE